MLIHLSSLMMNASGSTKFGRRRSTAVTCLIFDSTHEMSAPLIFVWMIFFLLACFPKVVRSTVVGPEQVQEEKSLGVLRKKPLEACWTPAWLSWLHMQRHTKHRQKRKRRAKRKQRPTPNLAALKRRQKRICWKISKRSSVAPWYFVSLGYVMIGRLMYVCVTHLYRCKTSITCYIFIYMRGITGVPGGSVINEDTSPGPVQTYPQDFGGAPGRI